MQKMPQGKGFYNYSISVDIFSQQLAIIKASEQAGVL
jgi:hypothetical protein